MRQTIPAAIAALLIGTVPALAADAQPSPDAGAAVEASPGSEAEASPGSETGATDELVRVEAPRVGLAIGFPAGWRVGAPEGERLSSLTTADGGEVMETTAFTANGADAWCNVDVYLDVDVPLQEHAFAYATFLQQSAGAESSMVVLDEELPAGPSVRIEIFDPERGRARSFYIFDGPAAEDGTFNRFLLNCAAPADTGPFWQAIAQSAEVFAPEPPTAAAAESPAPAESPAA